MNLSRAQSGQSDREVTPQGSENSDRFQNRNRQFAWATGKSSEDFLVSAQSDTEAFFGHLGKARELSQRAGALAQRGGQKETAAGWLMNAALREVEFGNAMQARRNAYYGLSFGLESGLAN